MTPAGDLPGALVEGVRRFGLASADMVADRYVRLAGLALGDRRERAAPLPADGLAEGVTALAATWVRLLEGTASLADRVAADTASTGTLDLPATGPGQAAEASLWVHNTTASSVAVSLAATSLAAPDGPAIPAGAVTFDPAGPARLGAGSSAEVRVRVQVPTGQEPGRYQGLAMTSAAPHPVLLRLEVAAGSAR